MTLKNREDLHLIFSFALYFMTMTELCKIHVMYCSNISVLVITHFKNVVDVYNHFPS